MNPIAKTNELLKRVYQWYLTMFKIPPRLQIGALCIRQKEGVNQVLLITSRKKERWIIPKGWPIENLSAQETALTEAFEEAGIRGEVEAQSIGKYRSQKNIGGGLKIETSVVVYPIRVTAQEKDFPESGQRKQSWLAIPDAARRCDEPGLADILKTLTH